eukprot:2202497-Rhodomonas_salina.1
MRGDATSLPAGNSTNSPLRRYCTDPGVNLHSRSAFKYKKQHSWCKYTQLRGVGVRDASRGVGGKGGNGGRRERAGEREGHLVEVRRATGIRTRSRLECCLVADVFVRSGSHGLRLSWNVGGRWRGDGELWRIVSLHLYIVRHGLVHASELLASLPMSLGKGLPKQHVRCGPTDCMLQVQGSNTPVPNTGYPGYKCMLPSSFSQSGRNSYLGTRTTEEPVPGTRVPGSRYWCPEFSVKSSIDAVTLKSQ